MVRGRRPFPDDPGRGIDRCRDVLVAKGVKVGYLPQEVITLRGNLVLEEVLKASDGVTSLQDKMRILEQELSSIDDPKEQERLALEYGKLQERYMLLGGYGLERKQSES